MPLAIAAMIFATGSSLQTRRGRLPHYLRGDNEALSQIIITVDSRAPTLSSLALQSWAQTIDTTQLILTAKRLKISLLPKQTVLWNPGCIFRHNRVTCATSFGVTRKTHKWHKSHNRQFDTCCTAEAQSMGLKQVILWLDLWVYHCQCILLRVIKCCATSPVEFKLKMTGHSTLSDGLTKTDAMYSMIKYYCGSALVVKIEQYVRENLHWLVCTSPFETHCTYNLRYLWNWHTHETHNM